MIIERRESAHGVQQVMTKPSQLMDMFKLIWEVKRGSLGSQRKDVIVISRGSTNTRLLTVMMDKTSKTTKKMERISCSLVTVTTSPQLSTSSRVWKLGTSVTFRGTGITLVSEWSCSGVRERRDYSDEDFDVDSFKI